MKIPKGFTLIELLVVIAIIAVIVTILVVRFDNARLRLRDSTRLSDITQIQNAIEIYYNRTGHYPVAPGTAGSAPCITGNQNWIPDNGNYNWSSDILPVQPHDPIDNCCWPEYSCVPLGKATMYEYWSDGTRYLIAVRLEDINNKAINGSSIIDPRSGTPFSNTGGSGNYGRYSFVVAN